MENGAGFCALSRHDDDVGWMVDFFPVNAFLKQHCNLFMTFLGHK